MDDQVWRNETIAGMILVLSFIALLPGLLMFWFRQGHKGGSPRSPAHYTWERAFVAAWVILSAIGFALLPNILQDAPGQILAVAGAAAYGLGSVLLAGAEILSPVAGYGKVYRLAVGYVIIAFLAQAALAGALLLSGLLPAWIGWAGIAWNIGWLIAIPLLSPRDIYFPILHSLMPLVVGIALLIK